MVFGDLVLSQTKRTTNQAEDSSLEVKLVRFRRTDSLVPKTKVS